LDLETALEVVVAIMRLTGKSRKLHYNYQNVISYLRRA